MTKEDAMFMDSFESDPDIDASCKKIARRQFDLRTHNYDIEKIKSDREDVQQFLHRHNEPLPIDFLEEVAIGLRVSYHLLTFSIMEELRRIVHRRIVYEVYGGNREAFLAANPVTGRGILQMLE